MSIKGFFACRVAASSNKELHLYILEGAMHNSFYSKNFILNVKD